MWNTRSFTKIHLMVLANYIPRCRAWQREGISSVPVGSGRTEQDAIRNIATGPQTWHVERG